MKNGKTYAGRTRGICGVNVAWAHIIIISKTRRAEEKHKHLSLHKPMDEEILDTSYHVLANHVSKGVVVAYSSVAKGRSRPGSSRGSWGNDRCRRPMNKGERKAIRGARRRAIVVIAGVVGNKTMIILLLRL